MLCSQCSYTIFCSEPNGAMKSLVNSKISFWGAPLWSLDYWDSNIIYISRSFDETSSHSRVLIYGRRHKQRADPQRKRQHLLQPRCPIAQLAAQALRREDPSTSARLAEVSAVVPITAVNTGIIESELGDWQLEDGDWRFGLKSGKL